MEHNDIGSLACCQLPEQCGLCRCTNESAWDWRFSLLAVISCDRRIRVPRSSKRHIEMSHRGHTVQIYKSEYVQKIYGASMMRHGCWCRVHESPAYKGDATSLACVYFIVSKHWPQMIFPMTRQAEGQIGLESTYHQSSDRQRPEANVIILLCGYPFETKKL